jgi:hypothetical protein
LTGFLVNGAKGFAMPNLPHSKMSKERYAIERAIHRDGYLKDLNDEGDCTSKG